MKRTISIDGSYISSLDTFYDEVEKKLTRNLDWKTGRNFDAFNDILKGGFGIYEYEEPIVLTWINSGKSQKVLSWEETIKYVSTKLKTCHSANIEFVKTDLALAKKYKGKTLFELIVDIIKSNQHIEFILC